MALATLTKTGRAAIAKAIAARPLHLAWGIGNPAWDEEGAQYPSLVTMTALVTEVGRRAPASIGFVEPDNEGDIVIPVTRGEDGTVQEARYRQVPGPTPYLYMRINFDYENASNAIIREMGVFMDTVVKSDLPPGQRYFTPTDLEDPGLLLAVQIIKPPITRSPSVRQTVEYVLPI
ncbi:hypothetical protein LJC22_04920 [Desulfosarcina sp. OttesenSCG-928-G10]|nr:hypothetical protein [Desulfosarcina sp. OttesenSCG-928-G10]MDL2321755.1 hypothetical protein [Desulfosarcina sp. OttesenSCG-928-B08]